MYNDHIKHNIVSVDKRILDDLSVFIRIEIKKIVIQIDGNNDFDNDEYMNILVSMVIKKHRKTNNNRKKIF
jgi:hypothetical protein